jgi:hypothetical protein
MGNSCKILGKKSPSPVHARGGLGMPPQENFEKLDPKSCNLSELKVILLNWKKTFFGGRIFCLVFSSI